MAKKLMVNNTNYEINGTIVVRNGSEPGKNAGTVNFKIAKGPGTNQSVEYGDANNPYMDQLTISTEANGAVILSDQVVITRGSDLDNLFNMNDTISIAITNQSIQISSSNS